jgi:hypothetical protein
LRARLTRCSGLGAVASREGSVGKPRAEADEAPAIAASDADGLRVSGDKLPYDHQEENDASPCEHPISLSTIHPSRTVSADGPHGVAPSALTGDPFAEIQAAAVAGEDLTSVPCPAFTALPHRKHSAIQCLTKGCS